jgi:hypothetical protein
LAEAGIEEVRFAGGTWQTGAQSGVTLAVFSADGLNPEQMLEFYEAGTRGSRRVERVDTAVYERNDTTLHRLDALNDASDQSILTWADGSIVRVVLVADSIGELNARADHEQRVEAALEASGAG